MALGQSALKLLGELELTDVSGRIRHAREKVYKGLIDAEAAAVVGAAPFERSPERVTQRNGMRSKTVITSAGQFGSPDPETACRIVFVVCWRGGGLIRRCSGR